MKKCGRKFRANSSGQLLIIAALAVAILISSTTIYVYEVTRETNSVDASSISTFIFALKQSTRNTMISSLANVSNGGDKGTLSANLNGLSQVFRSLNNFGICHLDYTLLSDSNYGEGVWLSWDISDIGVSSAYTDFTLNFYSFAVNITLNYAVNITTFITINGYYTKLVENEKLVNLTCNVYNEGEPALARNMTIFYENLGSWIPVDSSNNLSIMDYGNGTYLISFTVNVPVQSVQVSAHVSDLRDIFVQANTTCYEA